MAKSFEDLRIWQEAHVIVKKIYLLSAQFPFEEKYSLKDQIRRAAVSIAANIAEGFGRDTVKEKLRFYSISRGSLEECKYLSILSKDLQYANTDEVKQDLHRLGIMMNKYVKTIKLNANLP